MADGRRAISRGRIFREEDHHGLQHGGVRGDVSNLQESLCRQAMLNTSRPRLAQCEGPPVVTSSSDLVVSVGMLGTDANPEGQPYYIPTCLASCSSLLRRCTPELACSPILGLSSRPPSSDGLMSDGLLSKDFESRKQVTDLARPRKPVKGGVMYPSTSVVIPCQDKASLPPASNPLRSRRRSDDASHRRVLTGGQASSYPLDLRTFYPFPRQRAASDRTEGQGT
jgi:hypothetical protein